MSLTNWQARFMTIMHAKMFHLLTGGTCPGCQRKSFNPSEGEIISEARRSSSDNSYQKNRMRSKVTSYAARCKSCIHAQAKPLEQDEVLEGC